MRDTLIEVLGYERGSSMYSLEWLEQSARFHLDPDTCKGEIFVAEVEDKIVGHTIVRIEGGDGQHYGLFSTFYVLPDFQGKSAGKNLLNTVINYVKVQRGKVIYLNVNKRVLITM
jgi:GNAT superfamily N-acetyltransferase